MQMKADRSFIFFLTDLAIHSFCVWLLQYSKKCHTYQMLYESKDSRTTLSMGPRNVPYYTKDGAAGWRMEDVRSDCVFL